MNLLEESRGEDNLARSVTALYIQRSGHKDLIPCGTRLDKPSSAWTIERLSYSACTVTQPLNCISSTIRKRLYRRYTSHVTEMYDGVCFNLYRAIYNYTPSIEDCVACLRHELQSFKLQTKVLQSVSTQNLIPEAGSKPDHLIELLIIPH